MFLIKYFILFATAATIIEIMPFFLFSYQPLLRRQIPSTYHQYHRTYGYQAWQDDEFPPLAHSHNFTQPFGHVVLQDQMKTKAFLSSLP